MKTKDCERCGSKIVEERFRQSIDLVLSRHTDDGEWENADAQICSMCWDDLWEWVFDAEIDRSDKADPLPLDRMADNVERHIEDLRDILEELEEAKQ